MKQGLAHAILEHYTAEAELLIPRLHPSSTGIKHTQVRAGAGAVAQQLGALPAPVEA